MTRRGFLSALIIIPFIRLRADGVNLPDSYTQAREEESNEDRFLYAVSQKESGGNQYAIGPHGERTEFQFTRDTWRQHTSVPFWYAGTDREFDRMIARKHLRYLMDGLTYAAIYWSWNDSLPRLEHANQVYNLGLAWHYGLRGMMGRSYDDYALCVERLFLSRTVR